MLENNNDSNISNPEYNECIAKLDNIYQIKADGIKVVRETFIPGHPNFKQ